jgi:hypothetical protein
MFDCTPTLRRLAAVGTAVAAMASVAPLATAAYHPPVPASHSQATSPRPGEGLSGDDRAWLSDRPAPSIPGEGLTGADRSWLVPTTGGGGPAALPSDGFDWTDAGIGAGTVVAALFFVTGSAVVIRRRYSPAH